MFCWLKTNNCKMLWWNTDKQPWHVNGKPLFYSSRDSLNLCKEYLIVIKYKTSAIRRISNKVLIHGSHFCVITYTDNYRHFSGPPCTTTRFVVCFVTSQICLTFDNNNDRHKYQWLHEPAVGVAIDGWDGVMYDGNVDVISCVVAETYVIKLVIKTLINSSAASILCLRGTTMSPEARVYVLFVVLRRNKWIN